VNRVFELWVGEQGSGKTYQLRNRVCALARRPSIRSVLVLAPPGEWRDLLPIMPVDNLVNDDGALIRYAIVECELGSISSLETVLRLARHYGDVAIVIDEAWAWIPAGTVARAKAVQPILFDSVVRGRHVERWDRQLRPLHLIAATQLPHTVSHVVRDNAFTIMMGQTQAMDALTWVRGKAGVDAQRRVEKLQRYEWTAIRGRDPRRG